MHFVFSPNSFSPLLWSSLKRQIFSFNSCWQEVPFIKQEIWLWEIVISQIFWSYAVCYPTVEWYIWISPYRWAQHVCVLFLRPSVAVLAAMHYGEEFVHRLEFDRHLNKNTVWSEPQESDCHSNLICHYSGNSYFAE